MQNEFDRPRYGGQTGLFKRHRGFIKHKDITWIAGGGSPLRS